MKKVFETPLYAYERSKDQDATEIQRHPVVIVGAGPVGLAAAIDFAQRGIKTVVIDDNDKVSFGSRAICFAKRTLEIGDRLGVGQSWVDKGVTWNAGKVFFRDQETFRFDLLPESGHRRPAFINLQQYHLESILVDRVRALQAEGKPIEIRGRNQLSALADHGDFVRMEIDTPDGPYNLEASWLIACDGANSMIRQMLGKDFVGRVFDDNFLIADVIMEADFPSERWFWFDPPFNQGQSALLHQQPENVWRIDLQLGRDIDRDKEMRAENVIPRIKEMLGPDVPFKLEWVSIYTFQCRRMEKFRHGRVLFAGDSAHQVSPFGARGANSGFQDVDNLVWKLSLVIEGQADDAILDTYDFERILAADENIVNSARSTEFITPKSQQSRIFRNAVLDLAARAEFARPLVNSGRLSVPAIYDYSPLNTSEALDGPARSRPGAPCPDAALDDGYLLGRLSDGFTLLTINTDAPDEFEEAGVTVKRLALETGAHPKDSLKERYLGDCPSAVYLIRPDQHVAARRGLWDDTLFRKALRRAIAKD